MTIQPINNHPKTQKNTNMKHAVKYTGYGSLGFGIASVIAAKNKNIKLHKQFAYIAGILAVIHTTIVEIKHHLNKKQNPN